MKTYVLGFCFDANATHLALIRKEKPKWQKGFLNGIGGKIELTDKDVKHAMQREFLEETGVNTLPNDWDCFATMKFEDDMMGDLSVVHCLRNFTNQVFDCKTIETERVQIFRLPESPSFLYPSLQGQKIIGNLDVLIPMAKDRNFIFANLEML